MCKTKILDKILVIHILVEQVQTQTWPAFPLKLLKNLEISDALYNSLVKSFYK
jgi:hypothetical protein